MLLCVNNCEMCTVFICLMTMYVQVNVCLLGASTVVFVGEYYTNSDWR